MESLFKDEDTKLFKQLDDLKYVDFAHQLSILKRNTISQPNRENKDRVSLLQESQAIAHLHDQELLRQSANLATLKTASVQRNRAKLRQLQD